MVAFKEPLTKEEEEKYIKLFMSGNEEAKQILIEHNLRLVAHIIKKYSGCDKDINDMISIGTIGLIKAINTFNPNSGNKLVTYASRCIDNEILMFFRNEKKKNREVSLYEPIGTDKEGNVISIVDIVTLEDEDIVEKDDLYNKIKALREGLTTVLNEREKVILSYINNLQEENNRLNNIIDKAIEYIGQHFIEEGSCEINKITGEYTCEGNENFLEELLDILQGSDKE